MKYIIQIGSGKGCDHVTEIIKYNSEKYINFFVEPNPYIFEKLKNNYKKISNNCNFYNTAISTKNGKIEIHFNDIEGITSDSAQSSFNLDHVLKHGHKLENITTLNVKCSDLNTFLNENNLNEKEIEYLFIDTEGHDCDIILSTNFSNLNIENIYFEKLHTDGPFNQGEKFNKTKNYLTNIGYEYKGESKISEYDVHFKKYQ